MIIDILNDVLLGIVKNLLEAILLLLMTDAILQTELLMRIL